MTTLLTWSCHFCRRVRPDAQIAVVSRVRVLPAGVELRENRRYCSDRDDCVRAAGEWRGGLYRPTLRRGWFRRLRHT